MMDMSKKAIVVGIYTYKIAIISLVYKSLNYEQACLLIFLFLLSFLAHLNFFYMILSRCSCLLVLKS
jgi:hypothetical protein